MGHAPSRPSGSKKAFTIVMIGLDDAGKTSLITQLRHKKPGYLPRTITTIGAQVTTLSRSYADITILDLGGRIPTRSRWQYYYFQAQAFIFVVSATDASRLLEAREELHSLYQYRETRGRPLLVMVNKSEASPSLRKTKEIDPHAAPMEFVAAALDVGNAGFNVWGIKPVSALTGDGLEESLEWISQRVDVDEIREIPKPLLPSRYSISTVRTPRSKSNDGYLRSRRTYSNG